MRLLVNEPITHIGERVQPLKKLCDLLILSSGIIKELRNLLLV